MKKILITITVLMCLLAAAVFTIYQNFHPVSYEKASFSETSEIYNNPFRGFYHMYGFTLSEDNPDDTKERIKQYIESGNLPLMLIQVNLKNYKNSRLSANALEQLNNILYETDAAGHQVILRFLYDWDGKALQTEPDDITQITEHMEQISDVVNRYTGSVFLIQGTFAGNCGEMHGTKYGSHDDNRALITHLSEAISPYIYLSVRTPSHLRGVTKSRTPVSEDTAFNGSLGSRLGLFNDGLLGSVYDLGTYDDTPNSNTTEPEDKGTRDEEIRFQNDICRYVPNGGEAVIDNPYNDIDNAISDMSQMHISYLNCDHDAAVINKWKASAYHGNDCFDGINGYDYIDAHLGYRYFINDALISHGVLNGSRINISLNIQNNGFAPSYRRFDSSVSIINEDGTAVLTLPVESDNRTINSKDTETFSVTADISTLLYGNYRIYYSMTEPHTSRIIQFANTGKDKNLGVYLGNITVEKASPKKFFASVLSHLQNR